MNKSLHTLIAALLLSAASQAVAASSVDLSVRGLITPSACEPTLSNGGVYDLGKIAAKDLNPDQPSFFPYHALQMTVTCDAPTLMGLQSQDNRAGSHFQNDETYEFGLGLINGDEKLGALSLRLIRPLADGVEARTVGSEDGGATWYNERYLYRNNIVSVAALGTLVPIAVQVFSAELAIYPTIAPTNSLTLNNEVAIDGSVTLTVRYL
ncbi:DUF1120 domain-containing protein [Pseudomonas sp. EL_65y_Pfl1_R83]|uniref:DUF1120 domain-containing protein n=1 Tax=Pseudomonas sp. EL_65y_Pfl1_R83 TaxID=3088697 RepID=UPI0030DA56AB